MKHTQIILSLFFTSLSLAGQSQDLAQLRWKHRLVVILAKNSSQPALAEQLQELRREKVGLAERKCVIYRAMPTAWSSGLEEEADWKESGEWYADLKETGADFEVLLIGLDGGVKLRQTELLTCERLFGVIDKMPMRRAEMRRKGKK